MSEATEPAAKKARTRAAKTGAGSRADLPADPSSNGAARTAMALAPDLFPRLGQRSTWALALLALALGALAVVFGVGRPVHPDAWRAIGEWDVTRADWWMHPLERNAFRRLVVNGHLNAVAALPDGSQVWAVGSKGLILHSPDGGNSWTQSNPKPQAPPTSLVSGFGLGSVAHAQTGGGDGGGGDGGGDEGKGVGSGEAGPLRSPPKSKPLAAAARGEGSAGGTLRVEQRSAPKKDADAGGSTGKQKPATQTDPGTAAGGDAGQGLRNPTIDPLSADLFALHVVDEKTVYAVGAGGSLLATRDGGRSWQSLPSGTDRDLRGVSFMSDGKRGWVVGGAGTVRATGDAGQTWGIALRNSSINFNAVAFSADGKIGIIVGDRQTMQRTADGGGSWESSAFSDDESMRFTSLAMTSDGKRVHVVGNSGGFVRSEAFISSDGGVRWGRRVDLPQQVRFNAVVSVGAKVWSVGAKGALAVSNDAGLSWSDASANLRYDSRPGLADASRTMPTRSNLSGLTFASDGLRGWAVSSHGTILATSDGGGSWQPKTAGARVSWRAVRLAPDGLRGLALGADGALIRTDNGGLSWSVINTNIDDWLETMHASDDLQRIWATGLGGIVYFSSDGGITWSTKEIPGADSINSISVSDDGQRAVAVKPFGLYVMPGADLPWAASRRPDFMGFPLAVHMSRDGRRAWLALSSGAILLSVDGGRAFNAVGREAVDGSQLTAMHFSDDGRRGWAVGGNGAVIHSENGGTTWLDRHERRSTADLVAVATDSEGRRAWVAGRDGALMSTSDSGLVWTSQKAPPGTRLNSLSVAKDWRRALAVGENGDMISTDDGGVSWRDRVRYERYPAPLSVAAGLASLLLIVLVVGFGRWRAPKPLPPDDPFRVPPQLGSDQPLNRLADDRLGHAGAVLALSDFIRNPGTEPKLTIAITAPWGMGKTSMMGMLREQLEVAGFRTAWFNAWHHQQEGRQLSALFDTIRTQAVPSIFSEPAGAIRVRMRLLWSRGWLYRFAYVLLAFLVWDFYSGWSESELSAPHYVKHSVNHHWLNQPRVAITPATLEKINPFEARAEKPCDSVPAPQPRANAGLRAEVYCYMRQALVRPWDGQAQICNDPRAIGEQRCVFANSDELFGLIDRSMHGPDATRRLFAHERSLIAAALEQMRAPPMLPAITHFLPLLALLGLLMTKGFAVYGVELLAPLRHWLLARAGGDANSELPGTIEHYRTEFRLLTDALHGRLVVFIDDLDRCDAATVNSLLETSNYLIDHGRCFIVLGAAMDKVKACIEPKLGALTADERERYQTEYLRKLVHIELPVPPPSHSALDGMMAGEAADTSVNGAAPGRAAALLLVLRGAVLRCWHWLRRWSAIIVLGLAVLAMAQLARWMTSHDTPARIDRGQSVTATASPTPDAKASAPATGQAADATRAKPKAASDGFTGNVGLVAGEPSARIDGVLVFAMALLLALALIASRFQPVAMRLRVALGGALLTADTGQFMDALRIWRPAVRMGDATPRGIKRFANRARLFALHERKARGRKAMDEEHVVALTAMHHVQPEYLEWLLQQSLPEASASRADWLTKLEKPRGSTASAPLELQAQRQVAECLHEHVQRFGFPSADDLSRFRDLLARVSVR